MSTRSRINALIKAAQKTHGSIHKNIIAEEDENNPGRYHVYPPHLAGDPFEYPYNQTPIVETYTPEEIKAKYNLADNDILVLLTCKVLQTDHAE